MWFRRIRLRRVFILFSVLVVMAVPNGKWCLYQVGALRAMYVWFVGGMFVLGWRKLWEDWRVASPIMLLTFLVCMVMGDVYTNGLSFYKESSWLFDVLSSRRLFLLWVGRLLLGFGGIVSVLRLVYLMKDLLSKVDLVLMIGRNTLGIYVFHVFALRYLNLPKMSLIVAFIVSCVFLLICACMTTLVSKWPIGGFLLFGRWIKT